MSADTSVRQHGFVIFDETSSTNEAGWTLWRARGKTFLVEWAEASFHAKPLVRRGQDETIVIFPNTGGRVEQGGKCRDVPSRSVAVVPAGSFRLVSDGDRPVVLLSPLRAGIAGLPATNEKDYDNEDDGIRPVIAQGRRRDGVGLQVIDIDRVAPPADKPRLKMVRSATMSINWVEYEGVRDRSRLSPHSHDDFEQGSLAIEGSFIHHLRVPWESDANGWRDDIHLHAPARSLCVIPPRMIHTTEGKGDGRHLLIDIFAPVREDFLKKGWMANSSAYVD